MKWRQKEIGEIRTIKRFALLPIEIKGEVKWLERVKIKQVWAEGLADVIGEHWQDVCFVEKNRDL